MINAFTQKQLQASITINPSSSTPTFAGTGANTVTFGGDGANAIRMRAEIHNAGGIDGTLDLAVWGLPLSVMLQLSTYGQQINLLPKNQIQLSAGDSNGMSLAYTGSIIGCVIDFHQPDVAVRMTANAAAAFSAVTTDPKSYSGKADVATVMSSIADLMGLKFENNGVSAKLSNTYLYGSPRDMYNTVVAHADIYATIDRGTLAIWPKFKNRSGQAITISPQDGSMIDYPVYTSTGIMLGALYNPGFAIGKQVQVVGSQVQNANATWNIYGVDHVLECQMPGGRWQSTILATSPNFSTPLT